MARKFRLLLLASVLLLSFALPSGSAYADGYAGVVYGPKATAVVNPEYGVIVNAGSAFDAALYAIGYSPDSSEFTADVKAYLSNSDTGGAFYTFAQRFTNHNDKWGDGGFGGSDGANVGINDFDLNMTTSLKMFNNMYGPSNVWCGQYSAVERVSAVASVGLVLAGGVTGGGGGSSTDIPEGFKQIMGGSIDGYVAHLTRYYDSTPLSGFSVDFSNINSAKSFIDKYENILVVATPVNANTPDSMNVIIYGCDDGLLFLSTTEENSNVYYYKTVSGSVQYGVAYTFRANGVTDGTTVLATGKYSAGYPTVTNSQPQVVSHNLLFNYVACKGGTAPVVPPTNWPEPDPTPTPQPPEVDPPTTPDPPNVPTTDPPTYPPEVTYPDVTYVDADLTAVLDALNEHCEHLQHAIYTASSNLYSSLSSSISGEFTSLKTFIRALVSWNVDAMNANFDSLYTYLTDFAVWLEGCIRADDIVMLLEGIYNQMGNLDASTNDLVDLSALESTVSDISADVELIVQALNNLQDDNELLTIRGYLKGMYDWLHDFVIPDPVSVDLSTLEGHLSDISTDLDNFVNDFAVRWADLMNELDDIIDAINSINFSNRRWWKPVDLPDDPTVIVPVIRLPPEYYDPTNPRLPPFIEEPDAINIPALEAAFRELMTKFPFCMLNDLLNMLLYVVRPAAAPIFDLPVPNPSDWSSPHMITIDLSIFDPCASMLRMGITLWVGVKLARRSVKMWTNDNQEVVSV